MKVEIKVPNMGESISEATVGEIIKESGTKVSTDDEVLELETDKVNQVLYAPDSGVLTLNVNVEDTVKIGQVIGHVDTEGKGEEKKPEKKEESKGKPKEEKEEPKEEKEEPKEEKEQPKETPPDMGGVRSQAQDFIREIKDEKAFPAPMPRGERESRKRMSRIRKVIAGRLVEAQQSTAMLTTFNEIDMTAVMELREKYKEAFLKRYGVKLGFMSFFVKACVSALQHFPGINSYIDGEEIVRRHYYDIGIAVGTDRGLVVPVVKGCDALTFADIESNINDYAAKAKDGSLQVDDLKGGGFTITNGGIYGSLLSTPILNPPQSGILGMHKIEKRPIVIGDEIVVRPMMYVALSYDHRIVDGKEAVSFLVHVKNCLEDPARLILEV